MARMVVGYVRQPHVALLALFIALRGTAYTATLPRNSVAKRRSYSGWLGLMVAVGFIVLAQPAAASANAVTVAVDGIAPSKTLAVSVQGEGGAAVTGTIDPGGEHLLVKGDVVLAPDCAPRVPGRIEVDCGPSADFAKVIFNGDDTANVMRARFAAPVPVEAHGNGGARLA